MLEKATSAEISAYNGELRKCNDEREAQLLLEYDKAYMILKERGNELGLNLPPLFLKEFIDHGSVTLQNRNEDDVKSNIKKVLDYIEVHDMYDILAESRKGQGGYRIDASYITKVPSDVRDSIYKCTDSYITKVDGKTVRVRFINVKDLDPIYATQLKKKVAESRLNYKLGAINEVRCLRAQMVTIVDGFTAAVHQIKEIR